MCCSFLWPFTFRSPLLTKVHSFHWDSPFVLHHSISFDDCAMPYIHHYRIRWSSPAPAPSHPYCLPYKSLATTDPPTASVGFPFLECQSEHHIVWRLFRLAFFPYNMHLRFLHVFTWFNSSHFHGWVIHCEGSLCVSSWLDYQVSDT